MGDGERSGALGVLYGAVLTVVVLGGVFAIVDWARRGNDLPGGAVPVTGRVVQEEPGFAGARAIVEVSYEAGGKERRARLSVQDGDGDPNEPRYRPGDAISLKVSRTDPDRVQHASWDSGAGSTSIPGWVAALVAAGLIAPLLVPGARRRLEEAIDSFRAS